MQNGFYDKKIYANENLPLEWSNNVRMGIESMRFGAMFLVVFFTDMVYSQGEANMHDLYHTYNCPPAYWPLVGNVLVH